MQKNVVGGSLYRGKLVLTEKGRMAAEHISMRASKAVEMAGSELTDETWAVFYQALNSIVKNLKKLDRDGIPE